LATTEAVRDDALLPVTRWAALAIFCILVPAVIILWGFPGRTDDLWAWTISPDLIFLGASYAGGAYFFYPRRCGRSRGARVHVLPSHRKAPPERGFPLAGL
jgi:hypothetical protein